MSLSRASKSSSHEAVALRARSLLEICKAAGEEIRLEIIRVLSKGSFGVQELAKILSVPQPGMSHHLKILASAGLLATRRQGNAIFYRRALPAGDDALNALQAQLFASIDAEPLSDEVTRRMQTVFKERSVRSQEFFERNAQRFAESQGMLCEPSQYFGNMKEFLDLMALPKNSRVLEVGPGPGLWLAELARRFENVVALDESSEMLRLAEETLKAKSKKIKFVNCSLEAYSPSGKGFAAVFLNMVLHHMPSPERAFARLGSLVESGGYVLLAELCPHDQDWTKESCGDVWMGFDTEDLDEWATEAGFAEKQSAYLGLNNGFQIQLKLFVKT